MILTLWIAVRTTFIALDPEQAPDQSLATVPTVQPVPDRAATNASYALAAAPAPDAAPREDPSEPARHETSLATLALPYASRRGSGQAGRRAAYAGQAAPMAADEHSAGLAPATVAPFSGPLLSFTGSGTESTPTTAAAPERRGRRMARLSADGWVLLRGGGTAPALASGASAYGGSQAGAVLRYALAPGSALAPKAYVRVSSAVGGRVQQSETALGVMLRPVRRVPLAVMGEARLQQGSGGTRVRPVFMAVTELPPLRLPLRTEGEFYMQGGWAGGQDATGFFDLAATVQRPLGEPLGGIRLSAGGGVWSGGQRGAARLDVGPKIELRSMIGPTTRRIGVRVGVDWRFRVAGHAEPGSGPALTVAAGF